MGKSELLVEFMPCKPALYFTGEVVPAELQFRKFLRAAAATNFMLHMQQKLVLRHARPALVFSGLNVRSCRPAPRFT